MSTSTLLDIYNVNDAEFGPHQQSIAGYLDDVLSVFERHDHPFILVGILAMKWSGSNPTAGKEIDVLLKPSEMQPIASELVSSGEWAFSRNPYSFDPYDVRTYENTTAIREIWLVSRKEDLSGWLGLNYLRLWPEDLYKLSVTDCQKIEIPDILAKRRVLLEEEYYRDPHQRFGPPRLSVLGAHSEKIIYSPQNRCKKTRRDIPIFVPSIEDHLNALLDQRREEIATNSECGNFPAWHIRNFIRYHIWDWPPASSWLLSNKVHKRNYQDMKHLLESYVRKLLVLYDRHLGELRFNVLPWELTPGPSLSILEQDNSGTQSLSFGGTGPRVI